MDNVTSDVVNHKNNDDRTLIDDVKPGDLDRVVIEDWSGTGQGSHVEFKHDDRVPLEQGRFLGRGALGDVCETIVQEKRIAHKKMVFKRKIGSADRKEIEILKKLSSHSHMIQLVGTYTHRQFLGLLLYPVAVCDLHTFFDDVEAWTEARVADDDNLARPEVLDPMQVQRLSALGYDFPVPGARKRAAPIYHRLGCLVSAIAYLHDQQIRHKDLKPSNILLSKGRLWLSDFGSATDFSLLSQSATDNERGTPRYFSPEVAAWQPNGRAADMFSLGCILLEVIVLHDTGTLSHIRENRSSDPCFHANLDRVQTWCSASKHPISTRRELLLHEIKSLLSKNPDARPTATQLLTRVTGYDIAHLTKFKNSIFDECCRNEFRSREQRENEAVALRQAHQNLQEKADQVTRSRAQLQSVEAAYEAALSELKANLETERKAVEIEISQRIHGLQTEHANAVAERELKITMLSQQLSKIEEQFRLFKEQNADNCVAEDWHARGRRGQVSLPLPPVLTAKFDEPSHALKTEYDMHNSISQTNNLFHKQLARGMQSSEEYNKELESAKLNVDKINAAINAASDHDITSANDVSGVGADYPIHVWNHKLKKLVRPGGPPPEKKEAISKAYSSEFFKYGKDSLALRYKGPGVNPFSRFSDKYFWFDDKPNSTDPQHYPIYPSAKRHEVAAWLTQTGYGLLYFSTKYFSTYPQSHPRQVTILALQYADELVKIGDFGFSFKIDGQKHVFELPTPHVRDARIKRGFWIGRLDEVIEAAKGMRAKMESSAGYKSWFIRLESDPTLKMI